MSLGCPIAATCFLCTPPGETKHYFFFTHWVQLVLPCVHRGGGNYPPEHGYLPVATPLRKNGSPPSTGANGSSTRGSHINSLSSTLGFWLAWSCASLLWVHECDSPVVSEDILPTFLLFLNVSWPENWKLTVPQSPTLTRSHHINPEAHWKKSAPLTTVESSTNLGRYLERNLTT